MFSETRYALNGDLRVAYRGSAEVLGISCSSRTGSPPVSFFALMNPHIVARIFDVAGQPASAVFGRRHTRAAYTQVADRAATQAHARSHSPQCGRTYCLQAERAAHANTPAMLAACPVTRAVEACFGTTEIVWHGPQPTSPRVAPGAASAHRPLRQIGSLCDAYPVSCQLGRV
jgi:hypothetical protein